MESNLALDDAEIALLRQAPIVTTYLHGTLLAALQRLMEKGLLVKISGKRTHIGSTLLDAEGQVLTRDAYILGYNPRYELTESGRAVATLLGRSDGVHTYYGQ